MNIITTVEHEDVKHKDAIFYPGNYVENTFYIVQVTSHKNIGYDDNVETFKGTIIKRKTADDYHSKEGWFSDSWLVSRFEQFKGKIIIEVT